MCKLGQEQKIYTDFHFGGSGAIKVNQKNSLKAVYLVVFLVFQPVPKKSTQLCWFSYLKQNQVTTTTPKPLILCFAVQSFRNSLWSYKIMFCFVEGYFFLIVYEKGRHNPHDS